MIGENTWARESKNHPSACMRVLRSVRYQRAFIDFFEDQLVSNQYVLSEILDEYLLGGKEPLINGLISGRKYTDVFCRRC
jgi:hypothetical protein